MFWGIITLAVLVILLTIISIYNNLVNKRNDVKNAFAQIDVQLTRRYELIPNLVNIAKRYLQHEYETLVAVISARNHAADTLKQSNANAAGALTAAESALNTQLGGLYATFENYPDLKADTQLAALREEIASTENRIAFARQYFNDSVTEYNNALQTFPGNMVGAVFAFRPAEMLTFTDIADKQKPVRISFDE